MNPDEVSLPPDLARKVLGADLRNIVKKAGEGQTLTAQERKIVRDFLDDKADPEELLATRRRSLAQMWANGRKLSPEEFAEIADYLPADAARFTLESDTDAIEAAPASNGRYPRPLAHYAELYGQSERSVKRWISKGRNTQPPDYPPLASPQLMPLWFARHHKHRVPERLVALAAKHRDQIQPPPVAPVDPLPPPVAAEPAEAPVPTWRPPASLLEGSGFEAELTRVRDEARKAATAVSEAEKSGIAADIDAARRQYDKALKLLREYERDAPKILAATGNLVDRSVLEALLLPKHAAIRADLEAGYTIEVHRELRSPLEFSAARKIYLGVVHRSLRSLVSSGFGDGPIEPAPGT